MLHLVQGELLVVVAAPRGLEDLRLAPVHVGLQETAPELRVLAALHVLGHRAEAAVRALSPPRLVPFFILLETQSVEKVPQLLLLFRVLDAVDGHSLLAVRLRHHRLLCAPFDAVFDLPAHLAHRELHLAHLQRHVLERLAHEPLDQASHLRPVQVAEQLVAGRRRAHSVVLVTTTVTARVRVFVERVVIFGPAAAAAAGTVVAVGVAVGASTALPFLVFFYLALLVSFTHALFFFLLALLVALLRVFLFSVLLLELFLLLFGPFPGSSVAGVVRVRSTAYTCSHVLVGKRLLISFMLLVFLIFLRHSGRGRL